MPESLFLMKFQASVCTCAFQWKMNFTPDPTKEAQEVIFTRKLQNTNHPCLILNHTTVSLKTSWNSQKQPLDVFCKKVALRIFAKFTGKHLCQSLYFNKVAGLAYNFIKKETLAQMFSCEFYEISKNNFFTEHLRTTSSK